MAKYKVLRKCFGTDGDAGRLFKEGEIVEFDKDHKPSRHFELIVEGKKSEPSTSVPHNETKKQKIARLKAEAKAKKLAEQGN